MRLQFVCGQDLSSKLIAWYGNGYGGWSHVDAVLPDGSLLGARNDAIGSVPAGVQVRPPNYETWARSAVVEVPATPEEASQWEGWLKTQVGIHYDQQAIIGFILGRKDTDTGRWICSALQTRALIRANLMHPLPVPDSQVTPDALFLLVTGGLGGKVV